MSPKKFPELLQHVGEDLIVTDGTTLLGADDKAGIAEIVEAMVYLQHHKDIKHGKIRIAFNPDEEIGMGAHHFDVEKFGCQWAYTMDGGDVGELEYENFNAASAKITIKGVSVHPGYAKDKMVNANRLAVEFAAMLPADETPETTEGYQGFYHLLGITAGVEQARLSYIIRDHDRDRFEDRKRFIQRCADQLNEQYGEGTVACVVSDQEDRPADARHRPRAESHAGVRHSSQGEAHPWWYGRCTTVVQGFALPQHLCRRHQLPRSLRVCAHPVYGESHETDYQNLRTHSQL